MQLTLQLDIPQLPQPITYHNSILLIGSCFTENMSERLALHKFRVLSNPNGILFNPLSVAQSLDSYIDNRLYTENDLFQLNDLWNSWDHHTRFSDIDKQAALDHINQSQQHASEFVKTAGWVMITLGSSFQYYLKDSGKHVANNHRAPAQWFEKRLLDIHSITGTLSNTLSKLIAINPSVKLLFTISPVRHIRDGVIDNNRSKARLLEAVHLLCSEFSQAYYFPAYELIIDILRDYRYYDIDYVHPNYLATSFVWEQFVNSCIDPSTQKVMKEVQDIATARSHRPRFPETEGHRKFLASYAQKVETLTGLHPYLDLSHELAYFSGKNI
ncbi:GSCFA domain-containing protein [Polluticoccus soli]|uniref:GSCFA domain-containing protein n=1 Tax=Polluticoccus soli TaxID=3034150 RepID=UPI0023E30EEA|nr:GSCFA domain-containing protein [Flavipsychrobacter sp. JY13-12]